MSTTSAPPLSSAGPDEGPGEDAREDPQAAAIVQRMRLLAASIALVVLAFVQAPGRIVSDTKLDLAVDPVHFLSRAWHLWEPLGASGQLQNQAYGYFLPMGPFFALGHLLGFPAWVVQRAWWALIFLVAFHGLYRLATVLRVGTPTTRLFAAFAFALSPRMITEIGAISSEAWPGALAPWVLLPLIKVRPGQERRAAARSGLAIAMLGGINAVATGAVLPIPIWWLLTRRSSAMKRKLARWWAAAAFCGIAWWLVPLVLLGHYSPPFLDWIESAAVSTSKASLPGAFQGTTHWISWFQLPTPIWPAGWAVLTSPPGVILSWLLVGLAVIGLLISSMPHRTFLIGLVIAGLVLLTLGHTGPLSAPWAETFQRFLDGSGAPLRNTHKFDVLVRLPLAIGLAHALRVLSVPSVRNIRGTRLLSFVAGCAVLGSAAPALIGQLPPQGTFKEVPFYWTQTANWLADNPDGGRALVIPGANFPTSLWGSTHDEPLQPLARTPWAVRDGVPLSSAGNIRMLTTIEQQLSTGRGSPGLAAYLARAGISRLVVRADLVRDASSSDGDTPRPVTIQAALAASPGLKQVAAFGPKLGNEEPFGNIVADYGLDLEVDAVQIWEVEANAPLAQLTSAEDVVRVAGGPESLLTLEEDGTLDGRLTVLDGDPEAQSLQTAPLVVTDTEQKREANFSAVRDVYSPVMTADQPYTLLRKDHDWLPFEAPEVTARYDGISGYRQSAASDSASSAWYAVDGDPSTAWISSSLAVGQWMELGFPRATRLGEPLTLTGAAKGARATRVKVTTDAGSVSTTLRADAKGRPVAHQIKVPAGNSRTLRITVEAVAPGDSLSPASFSEVKIPGIDPRRDLVLPDVADEVPTTAPTVASVIALRAARGGEDACVDVSDRAWCSETLPRPNEENTIERQVDVPAAASYTVTGTVRPRATAAWDQTLASRDPDLTVTATSRRADEPAERPAAAGDGEDGTAWVAASWDTQPTITLKWNQVRTVRAVTWETAGPLSVSRPTQVRVEGGGLRKLVDLDDAGRISFPAVRTNQLTIKVLKSAPLETRDPKSGYPSTMPIGASELRVAGAEPSPQPEGWRGVTLPCGSGPTLQVGDKSIRTSVSGTVASVIDRSSMTLKTCDAVGELPAGPVQVSLGSNEKFVAESLTLKATGAAALPKAGPQAVTAASFKELSPEHRQVQVPSSATNQVLVVHENANPGWKAELGGKALTSVRIDGWQQGWVIPAGMSGTVELTFPAGGIYRAALIGGLALVVLLAMLSLPDPGRGRRQRVPDPVPLVAARRRRVYGVLGGGVLVFLGGVWGVVALFCASLLLRRVSGWVAAAGACVVMGLLAVPRVTEADNWFLGALGTAAGLLTAAFLVLRVDSDHDRTLGRALGRGTDAVLVGVRTVRGGLRPPAAPAGTSPVDGASASSSEEGAASAEGAAAEGAPRRREAAPEEAPRREGSEVRTRRSARNDSAATRGERRRR